MELLKANGYETCVVGRPDTVTAEDWHDPAQLAKCADRFLCTVTSKSKPGPGNYFKEVPANPWSTHTRFLVSNRLLIDENYTAPLRDLLGTFRSV